MIKVLLKGMTVIWHCSPTDRQTEQMMEDVHLSFLLFLWCERKSNRFFFISTKLQIDHFSKWGITQTSQDLKLKSVYFKIANERKGKHIFKINKATSNCIVFIEYKKRHQTPFKTCEAVPQKNLDIVYLYLNPEKFFCKFQVKLRITSGLMMIQ